MTDTQILDDLIRREAGFVEHPADRGGPTKYGITLATLAAWRKQPVTREDVKALSEAEAREILTERYAAPFVAITDDRLRAQLVDIAVNSGAPRAHGLYVLAAQDAKQTGRSIHTELTAARIRYYGRIVQRDASQRVFLSGWLNRALEFLS